MKHNRIITTFAGVLGILLLSGCVSRPAPYDYTEFQRAKPVTLLILPPLNNSPEVKATSSVWSHATRPLAEAGYYVLPVTLVNETLQNNGMTTAHDAQNIPYPKLQEVFGADAALYMQIKRYGTDYRVVSSDTRVELQGQLIDLRTGLVLWEGSAVASSSEQQQQNQGGVVGMLVTALIEQIANTASEASHRFAEIASTRLLSPRYNGILPGPRSPEYGRPPRTE